MTLFLRIQSLLFKAMELESEESEQSWNCEH